LAPATFSIAVNDWGFEILSPQPISFGSDSIETFFKGYNYENLAEEITQCLNSTEMARRQFREIARVAGLIFQGYPGASKTIKQVQISSSLLYDVFVDFDPGNLLVRQAHDEVMEKHLEISRMIETLQRLSASEIVVVDPVKASPFCMPLMVDRLRGKLSSEKLAQRVLRMHMDLAGDMRR
jgi:ATP-dependent Lhr-like helicase